LAESPASSRSSIRDSKMLSSAIWVAALSGPHHSPSTYEQDAELRKDTASFLHGEVAAMNVNNFIVRPKRWLIEKYGRAEAWENLELEQRAELIHEVAGLPSEQVDEDQDAKEFDFLMLRLQLAVLRAEKSFTRLRDQLKEIASALEEKANIPMVQQQIVLIEEIQTDDFWQDVTAPMLDNVRKKLRSLVSRPI
jgi:type I restriction enzyme R subunit